MKRSRNMSKKLLSLLLILAVLFLSGCGADKNDRNDEENRVPVATIQPDEGTESENDAENTPNPQPLTGQAFLQHLLETLTAEDIKGIEGDIAADADALTEKIRAAAKNSKDPMWDNPSPYQITLYLTENREDSGKPYEKINFRIHTQNDIIDVLYLTGNAAEDTADHIDLRLQNSDLYGYLCHLYFTHHPVDETALEKYGEILARRAQWRMDEYNARHCEYGLPAFTGFDITYLRLYDTFDHGIYHYDIYLWDTGFYTDSPDPGQYIWPQDIMPDELGRICNYDMARYFVTARVHDDLEYDFFPDAYLYYELDLYFYADIIKNFEGEKVYLESTSEHGHDAYTSDGAFIWLPDNLVHLVEAHSDDSIWCTGVVVNPSYYLDDPHMTEQTLFAVHHVCDYWYSGDGLLFSIRRYTEEEYGPLYLDSYSRQRVFARDENYYYCVFLPTREPTEDALTEAILAELLDQQLEKITAIMIDLNGWTPYTDAATLSAEDLAYFTEYTRSSTDEGITPISCFFTSSYSDPRDMDAEEFLRYCPDEYTLSLEDEAEFRLVQKKLGWLGEDGLPITLEEMPVPCHRYSRAYLNDILMRYAGITVADMNTDWTKELLYIPETDCFYNFTSDCGPGTFTPHCGVMNEDIVILWETGDNAAILTLQKFEDHWRVVSFRKTNS